MNCRFYVALSLLLTASNAYKILVLGPMNGKSHFLYISSFVQALVDRRHEVTYLTSNSLRKFNLANYTEVLIDPPLDLHKAISQRQLIDMASQSMFTTIKTMPVFMKKMNEYALENQYVQKFIKAEGLQFDIIVAEEFFSDSFLMFAHKFKAPVVTIGSFGPTEFIDRQQGLLTPSSFVPQCVRIVINQPFWSVSVVSSVTVNMVFTILRSLTSDVDFKLILDMMAYTDNMSFVERWYNTIVTFYDWYIRHTVYLPSERALANKYFAHLAPLPPLDDIMRNVSVVLVNSHRSFSPPRPTMPNVIQIGGAHIKPVKPLPNDLKTFLDGATNGVIYLSLGTVIKSSGLPPHLMQAFLSTFKNLNQRVLWKFEDESLTEIPPNVMVRKWMPQNDILAHPNVILFISHGGLFGSTESLYHGVPMLLIPFFGDQSRNAIRIKLAGFGEFITLDDVTSESLSKTLNQMLSDGKYLQKARQTSEVFKDNIIDPMDEAMFWIEHVAKFKGAKHLKSHAINMSWFTYLLLDVHLVNVLAILMIVFVLRATFRKLCGSKKRENVLKENKRK